MEERTRYQNIILGVLAAMVVIFGVLTGVMRSQKGVLFHDALLDVLFPTALFYINHACDVRDPEPSDFYITMQKASWAIYPCFLLGGYIHVLTQVWQ